MKRIVFYPLILIPILLSACVPTASATSAPVTSEPPTTEPVETGSLQLISDVFEHEGTIPAKYACGSDNVSPALHWTEPPSGTQSFALIMDDPDAGGTPFVHWVIYNIPASTRELPEAIPNDQALSDGSMNGRTSLYSVGYMGPCPPSGAHHYVFKLYALDTTLEFPAPATKEDLLKAMEGHILGQAELVGIYSQ